MIYLFSFSKYLSQNKIISLVSHLQFIIFQLINTFSLINILLFDFCLISQNTFSNLKSWTSFYLICIVTPFHYKRIFKFIFFDKKFKNILIILIITKRNEFINTLLPNTSPVYFQIQHLHNCLFIKWVSRYFFNQLSIIHNQLNQTSANQFENYKTKMYHHSTSLALAQCFVIVGSSLTFFFFTSFFAPRS